MAAKPSSTALWLWTVALVLSGAAVWRWSRPVQTPLAPEAVKSMQLESAADFRHFERLTEAEKIMDLSDADKALVRRYIGRDAASGSLAAYVLGKLHKDETAMSLKDAYVELYRRRGDDGTKEKLPIIYEERGMKAISAFLRTLK